MKSLIQRIKECYFSESNIEIFLTFNDYTYVNKDEYEVFITFKGSNELKQKVNDNLFVLTCEGSDIINRDSEKAILRKFNCIKTIDFWGFISKKCSGTDISYLKAPGSNLKGALFENCNLSFCNLIGANLEKASLENSIAHFSSFERANLSYANLCKVDFDSSDLRRCDLKNSDARNANFSNTALRGAELWGSLLWDCNFTGAFDRGVDFSRGDYRGVTVQ